MKEEVGDEELTAQINAALAAEAAQTADDSAKEEALEAWFQEAGRPAWDAVEWKE